MDKPEERKMAIEICKNEKKISGNIDDVLSRHCGLLEEKDRKLIEIIKKNHKILKQINKSLKSYSKEKYYLLYKLWSKSNKK